ncbi:MAG: cell division protease FtsH [Planctomycetota bacterium]|jgi:cell division protease FtsH
MADSQNQGEKARKPRPFGSFLLFLTVIIVVLVAFSGSQLRNEKEFSQDVFEHSLVTGRIQRLEFKGQNDVEGVLENGQRFHTSFASLEAKESRWREMKAKARYTPVQAPDVEAAIDAGNFVPSEAWLVTEISRDASSMNDDGSEDFDSGSDTSDSSDGVKPRGATRHTDKLFVFGTAKAGASFDKILGGSPDSDQVVGLQVTKVSPHLASLLGKLNTAGVTPEVFSFDLLEDGGTVHGPADGSITMMLLAWGPWILIFAVFLLFMRQMRSQGSGQGVMNFGRSRAQMYTKENHTGVTFEDVAGAQEAKAEVREVVEFLKNPGRFTRIGGRIPRGVLLVGSPGCGKTLLAKAIAGEAEVPFFSISGSDFVEMFVGVGASRVRDLFKTARENSPCIIFLDEIDAVGRRRGGGMGGGNDEREQTLNAILVEMDGFSTDEGIIVVAATNRPDVLDPALLRPGRFDREVTIELPDMEGREAILNVHLKKVKVDKEVDAIDLARATPGYSGADLAAIVNEAAIMAVLDKKDEIEMSHLEEAAAKIRYGRQKISRNVEADDLEITAYHEAGHTIVAAKLEGQIDVPHKVTIVPRGRALGATLMLPQKESYHTQKKRLEGQLAMLFGGRVAEEIFCGDISAGASDDIRRATELTRAMVTELGMSEAIGPINYAERQGSDFLGTELGASKWHSEETAREIDEEIKRFLKVAYELAKRLVGEEKEAVERLTKGLLLYETLEKAEIQKLIAGTDPADLREQTAEELREERRSKKATPPPRPEADLELGGEGPSLSGLSPA